MDSAAFDRLSRFMGRATSRRAGLRAALGASLGFGAAAAESEASSRRGLPAAAAKCKQDQSTCRRDSECCANNCVAGGNGSSGVCACIKSGESCRENQTCCGSMVCVAGKCSPGSQKKVGTGRPCSRRDVCKNRKASCVRYRSGSPRGTYCLYPDGVRCGRDGVCASGKCRKEVCAEAGSANGGACSSPSSCEDPNAVCAPYAANGPAGTWCLLPASAACGRDSECLSGFCSGGTCAAGCTVCASGCGYSSIAAAYAAASPGAVIGVAPGTYNETIAIDRSVTIRRCGLQGAVRWTTSSAGSNDALIHAASGSPSIVLQDLDLTASIPLGALIRLQGADDVTYPTLNAANLVIHDFVGDTNSAVTIKAWGAATFTGCTFTGNSAAVHGGAIHAFGDVELTLDDCTFSGNSAAYNGGAVNLYGGVASITGCAFSNNAANNWAGGAFATDSAIAVIAGSTFSGNQAPSGGGIAVKYASSVTLTDCTVSGNQAGSQGGGVLVWVEDDSATLTLAGSTTVTGNSIAAGPNRHGSGIAAYYATPAQGSIAITGAGTRVAGNVTPPAQCMTSPDNGASWNDVAGCAF